MVGFEYRSRTATLPVFKLPDNVLLVREQGISAVRDAISKVHAKNDLERSTQRKLIASMNFSVSQVKKELDKRKVQR